MAREREVKVTILGEDKGASRALNQVDAAAAKLGPSGKIAENAISGVTSKLTSGLGPGADVAKGALDKVGASALSSGGLLTSALAGGAAVAGAALVAFAADGIGKMVDLASEVRNFGRATGLSAEDSSRMVAVLDDLGISSEVGAGAMFKLAKNTADGGAKLALYGVDVARAKDGNVDLFGTLLSVADAYVATEDPGKRAELVMAAFGKTGQALIPILEKGSAGLTAMFDAVKRGEILSQKQIDQTREFELAVDDVQDSFRSLQIQAAGVLLPYVTSVLEAGTVTLDFLGESKLGGIAGKFAKIVVDGTPVGSALNAIKNAFGGAGEEAQGAAAKFDLQVVALEQMGVEVSDAEKATGKLTEETKKAAAEAEKYQAKIDAMAAAIGSAYTAMGGASDELSAKLGDQARAYDTAKTSADMLKQGLDILTGVKIAATTAAINWESQIVATSKALGENAATLDITTEAGRENTSAILKMITTGNAHVEAMAREGASSAELTAAYGDHVGALRRVMTQAGYTDEQINALLEKYNLLAGAPDISKAVSINVTTYYKSIGLPSAYAEGAGQRASEGYYGPAFHGGGIVGGYGDVPILAQGGEGVFTPDQMAVLGASMGRGGWDGESGGSSVEVHVSVGNLVGSDGMRELTEMIQSQLLQKQRRVPSLGLT